MSRQIILFYLVLLLPLLGLITSCANNESPRPENLIPEDDYIELLIELQLLESYQESNPEDSAKVNTDSLTQLIFDKYKVTRQQFVTSHEYYQREIKPQVDRIASAIDSLRKQMVEDGLVDSNKQNRSKRPEHSVK